MIAPRCPQELARQNLTHCDYVLSGIPFSILEINKKRQVLKNTYDSLVPGGDFVIYQVTNELRAHCVPDIFPRADSEYCLINVPPMFITVFHKDAAPSRVDQRHPQQRGQRPARQEPSEPPGRLPTRACVEAFSDLHAPPSPPMTTPVTTRTEKDSMGEMPVPADALYGATTQRAVLNFPISGYRFGRSFLRALGLVKQAAARANLEVGQARLDAGANGSTRRRRN